VGPLGCRILVVLLSNSPDHLGAAKAFLFLFGHFLSIAFPSASESFCFAMTFDAVSQAALTNRCSLTARSTLKCPGYQMAASIGSPADWCDKGCAHMKPNVIVWDLETVPDLPGFAAANDLCRGEGCGLFARPSATGSRSTSTIPSCAIGALVAHARAADRRFPPARPPGAGGCPSPAARLAARRFSCRSRTGGDLKFSLT
jgi:hypothetical protein